MSLRDTWTKIKNWIERWWVPISIVELMLFITIISYILSSNVEPIDFVATAGSLVFSAFLIYIYYNQNKILERQEDILEDQFEVQEAAQVEPKLNKNNWTINQSELSIYLQNIGEGDAYEVSVCTELSFFKQKDNIQTSEWCGILENHLTSGEAKEYSKELLFNIGSLDEYLNNEQVEKELDSDDYSDNIGFDTFCEIVLERQLPSKGQVSIFIKYKSSTGEEYKLDVCSEVVNIDEVTKLSYDKEVGFATENLRPELGIKNMFVYNPESFDDTDTDILSIDLENKGERKAIIEDIGSEVRIHSEQDELVSRSYFEDNNMEVLFSGTGTPTDIDQEVEIGQSESVDCVLSFIVDTHQQHSFKQLSKIYTSDYIDNPISIWIKIRYSDMAGRRYTLQERLCGIFKENSELSESKYNKWAKISEAIRLSDVPNHYSKLT